MGIKVLLVIVAGIFFDTILNPDIKFYIIAIPFVIVFAILSSNALFILLALLSGLNTHFHNPDFDLSTKLENLYQCVVYGEDQKENKLKLKLKIKRMIIGNDTIPMSLYANHYTYQLDHYLGMTLTIKGRLFLAEHPYQTNLLVGEIIDKDYSLSFSGRIFHHISNYIYKTIKTLIVQDRAPIALGLILGGSSRLNSELKKVFARAGVLHILAVSGLHLGFIIALLATLFLPLPIPRHFKFCLIMLFLLLYAGITGFRPSVLRAALMAFLFGISFILQREVDPIHIVNMVAMMVLLSNPFLLFDVGAQLSFSAVYGILYLMPRLNELISKAIKNRILKNILVSMATSFSAQAFVSPFLIQHFHQLPTLAVFSNLIIVPITAGIIYLSFLLLLASPIFMPAAQMFSFLANQALYILVNVTKFFADLPFSSISLRISPLFLILYFFIFCKRTRKVAIFTLLILGIIYSFNSLIPVSSIRMAKNSALITLPNRERVLVFKESSNLVELFDVDGVEYLIGPNKILQPKKEFIPLPAQLYYKKIDLCGLRIYLGEKIVIDVHGCEYPIPEHGDYGRIRWIILGQKGIYQFESSSGSVFDDIFTNIRYQIGVLKTAFL